MKMRPVVFAWDGDNMVPLPRFKKLCDKQFVVGEEYPLEQVENRSMVSHNHFFASVHEAWMNIPESLAPRYPTSEHLRKWCLCQVGCCDEANYVLDTPKDAKSMAAAIRRADEFAVIVVKGNIVRVYTAKSQAMHSMRKGEFQEAKTAVLDLLASMVNIKRSELEKAGAQHAPKRRPIIQEGTTL